MSLTTQQQEPLPCTYISLFSQAHVSVSEHPCQGCGLRQCCRRRRRILPRRQSRVRRMTRQQTLWIKTRPGNKIIKEHEDKA